MLSFSVMVEESVDGFCNVLRMIVKQHGQEVISSSMTTREQPQI